MPGLIEVTPKEIIEKGLGVHKICLVSQKNCSDEENDFLAGEVVSLLEDRSREN